MTKDEILDYPWVFDDVEADSIREYLYALLDTLWAEGEGFSGKRPFGNSGWEFDLYTPLVKMGVIAGELDAEQGLIDVNTLQGAEVIFGLIRYIFFGEEN